jgi:hypothetical protein
MTELLKDWRNEQVSDLCPIISLADVISEQRSGFGKLSIVTEPVHTQQKTNTFFINTIKPINALSSQQNPYIN